MYTFVFSFFHLAWYFWDSCILCYLSTIILFLCWLVLHGRLKQFILLILLLVDVWIVASFWLLWIKLLWKFLYVSLDTQRCVFLLDINPGMELLACSLYVCSAWVAALKQFSKIYTCTVRIWELQLLHMLQYILLFSYH